MSSQEKNEKKEVKRVPVIRIDLKDTYDGEGAVRKTLSEIDKHTGNRKDIVLCVFEGENIKSVLKHEIFHGSMRREFRTENLDDRGSAFALIANDLADYSVPAIAVYEQGKLEYVSEKDDRFKVKTGLTVRDALILVGKFIL